MSTQTQAIASDVSQLAEDARALMAATADMAGEQVEAARKRLSAALDSGRNMYGQVKDKAMEGAKAADLAMHDHPYKAVATGIGLGAVFGYLIARRCRCQCS
jgi:ElaB/YqjD/DUF883 family membrane-anchored ribosome-binding protein